jgi:hypothetical protein
LAILKFWGIWRFLVVTYLQNLLVIRGVYFQLQKKEKTKTNPVETAFDAYDTADHLVVHYRQDRTRGFFIIVWMFSVLRMCVWVGVGFGDFVFSSPFLGIVNVSSYISC